MPAPQPSRRELLHMMGGAAAAGMLGGRRALAEDRPWNVLVLVSDEHNPRLAPPHGPDWLKTPNLKRLASEGVTMSRSYATSPLCAPARMGLLTGKMPQETGVLSNGHALDPRTRTFAHTFSEAGYHTACVGKTHVYDAGATYGFDTWLAKETDAFKMLMRARREECAPQPIPVLERPLWNGIADRRLRGAPIDAPWTPISGAVIDVLKQWLSAPSEKPFFYYGSWTEPHWVWNLPRDLYDLYDPSSLTLPAAGPKTLAAVPQQIRDNNGWAEMSEAQHRLCLAKYAGAITYTDRVLGAILDALDQSGQADRTIVVYTTDHGDMSAWKRMWLKGVMYDQACGIPMIVRMPGVLPAGSTCDALMSGADLFPTLAALTGVPAPAGLSGRDVSAAMKGQGGGAEQVFATLGGRPGNALMPQTMVRDERYKLIRYRADPGQGLPESRELYDLLQDPDETRDLMSTIAGRSRADRMSARADSWLQLLPPCPYPLRHAADLQRDDDDPEDERGD